MSESRILAERHSVTVTQRSVYSYNGYTYDNLSDALNYAELARSRAMAQADQKPVQRTGADRR